jgi:hypothetical protein
MMQGVLAGMQSAGAALVSYAQGLAASIGSALSVTPDGGPPSPAGARLGFKPATPNFNSPLGTSPGMKRGAWLDDLRSRSHARTMLADRHGGSRVAVSDNRRNNVDVTVNGANDRNVGRKVAQAVLGAISTKGSNTSTGEITAA